MEIKNILGKLNQTEEEPKKFFAIEIGYEVVKSAVWHVKEKATQIVSVGSIEEWKDDSADTLLHAIDKSLSVATKELEAEPNEVIFGLPESWVGTEGIAEGKKPYLKEITQKLGLKPVGFVVTTEAIVHHLRLKEGGPPSAILTSLTESEVVISVVKQGEILGSHVVGRSDDLCKDVEEGLARFGDIGDLPSRIIVYDGNIDLEAAKQTLINYDWLDTVNFLHFPKIEDLDSHSTITAVAIAGGTEVAKSLGIQIIEEKPDSKTKNETNIEPVLAPKMPTEEAAETLDPAEFGFSDPRKDAPVEMPAVGDNFQSIPDSPEPEMQETAIPQTAEPEDDSRPVSPVKKSKFSFKLPAFPKFQRRASVPQSKPRLPAIIPIGIATLVLIVVGAAFAYWQIPRAEVTIYTKPKQVEKDITFTLNAGQDVLDVQNAIVSAKEESIELEGEKEIPTTGTKVVGERAKGKANIFNLTQSPRTFEAGTKINFDRYVFTTDTAVTIASATAEISADYKTTVTPSQESVTVTAADIGDQYNFSAGTEMTIASFAKSSFVAKASSDFKGGFAREIQAVSKEDQANIREALLGELKSQGINNLSVIASQKKGVVELEAEDVVDETYSAEVGDEEDNLRLALQFKLPIYTYQLSDVGAILQQKFAGDFPSNFTLDPDNINVEIIKTSLNEDGTVEVNAKVKLNLMPQLNPQEIAAQIKGKYPEVTKNYFTGLPNFSKVETKFSVNLPPKLQTFPRITDHITVTIKLEE